MGTIFFFTALTVAVAIVLVAISKENKYICIRNYLNLKLTTDILSTKYFASNTDTTIFSVLWITMLRTIKYTEDQMS